MKQNQPDLIIYAAVCLFLFLPPLLYGQSQDENGGKNETVKIVEQALNDYDTKKQNKQEEFKALLNSHLDKAAKTWIEKMENSRHKQLDSVVEQDWDKQARTAVILPASYKYYLRGYKYNVVDKDIIKTESLSPVYKGIVNIKEELYAEISHHSNVSDLKQYLYTVTSLYTLNFIYMNGGFELATTDVKLESKVNEMSDEARREWLWYHL